MTHPLCALADVKIELNDTADEINTALLTRLIDVATDALQRVTGRSFAQIVATGEVVRAPDVTIGRDGTLRVRLRTPRITAVTALAVRAGTPAAAWTAVALAAVDWDPDPLRASSVIRAYGLPPARPPLWAQVSYTAGWVGDHDDPYPPDLQEVAIWWVGYLYRTKDAPFEKTANPMLGTITIPSAMPARLKQAVERWKAAPVV